LYQAEQETLLGRRSEVEVYDDIMQWLDAADEMLKIVEESVEDHETEFSVGLHVSWERS